MRWICLVKINLTHPWIVTWSSNAFLTWCFKDSSSQLVKIWNDLWIQGTIRWLFKTYSWRRTTLFKQTFRFGSCAETNRHQWKTQNDITFKAHSCMGQLKLSLTLLAINCFKPFFHQRFLLREATPLFCLNLISSNWLQLKDQGQRGKVASRKKFAGGKPA